MAIGKEIKVVLSLDDKGFKVGVRDASGHLQQFSKSADATAQSVGRVERHMTSASAKAHRMVMSMGMARFALMDMRDIFLSLPLAVLRTSGEIERLGKLMEGLSTHADAAARKLEGASNVKFIFDMAQNAPFEVTALADSFVKLKTGGIDPTNGSMQALIDSVARFGGNSDALKRASIAIQQMGGKGVVSMEELRQQLGEAVPTAMKSMADGMGWTMSELANTVGKGVVQASSAVSKMMAAMHVENAGSAAALMTTWTGLLERLKTKWELMKLEMGAEGLFETSKKSLEELIKAMDGDAAGSFARNLGGKMNSATKFVIDLTKTIVEMSDTIMNAGKALLIYWGASRIAGPIAAMSTGMKGFTASIIENAGASKRAYQAERLDQAAQLNSWAAKNDRLIGIETKRLIAEKANGSARVSAAVKANNAEVLAAKTKAAQLLAIEQNLRMQSMAISLEAERVARTKRAGSGAAARGLMADAGRITNNANVLKSEREALLANAAAVDKRSAAILSANKVSQAANVTTAASVVALQGKSTALRTMAAAQEKAAHTISRTSAAMMAMSSAAATVGTAMKSMIFSLNGLIAVIMAAAWAWDHFSSKARQAAKDADSALASKSRLERGGATEDTVQEVGREKDARIKERDDLGRLIKLEEGRVKTDYASAGLKKLHQERLDKYKALTQEIDKLSASHMAEQKQVSSKRAQSEARELVDTSINAANTAMQAIKNGENAANARYRELSKLSKDKKLTPAQDEEYAAMQPGFLMQTLEVERASLEESAKGYRASAASAGKATEAGQKYLEAVSQLENKIGQVDAQIVALAGPRVLNAPTKGPKGPKGGKESKVDTIISALARENIGLAAAKAQLQSILDGVSDVAALRAEAVAKVDEMIASDELRGKKVKHTPAQREQLIEAMTDKVAVDAAIKEMTSLNRRLEAAKEKQTQTRERMQSGDSDGPGKTTETQRTIAYLTRLSSVSKEAAAAFAPVIEGQRELAKIAADTDLMNSVMDNDKRIGTLRIANITHVGQQMQEAHELELTGLTKKYQREVQAAADAGLDVNVLMEQFYAERELMNERHFENMKTPAEKLTDEWKKSTTAMKEATASWSNDSIEAIVSMASTGKFEFADFARSVMADMMRIQLRQTMGDGLTSGMTKLGGKFMSMIGSNEPAVKPATPMADPQVATAAATALQGLVANVDLTGAALAGLSSQGIAGMTKSTADAVIGTITKAGADSAATAGVTIMGTAADLATAALWQLSASAKAAAIASVSPFANGGIMSSAGSLPLKAYANGGIANSPQLALFGEGRMNEAYVPLPDGRTIPVTMNGGGGGAPPVSLQVNVVNQSGQAVEGRQQGHARFDGRQMILDVVLTAAGQPGAFRDGMKGSLRG